MNIWIGKELEKKWRKESNKGWITQLKEEKCRILWGTALDTDGQGQDMVCITDSEEEMKEIKKKGYPCIFVETGGHKIYGADLVVEDSKDLTGELCKKVYCRHYEIPSVILETERLIIRETVREDARELYRIYDGAVYLEALPKNVKEEEKILSSYFQNIYGFYGYGMWSVIEKESGTLIGRVGLENGGWDLGGILELGYLIGKEWRRRGYGFEAANAVLYYAKEKLEEKWLHLRTHRENVPSVKLAEKLGFQKIKEADICLFRKEL